MRPNLIVRRGLGMMAVVALVVLSGEAVSANAPAPPPSRRADSDRPTAPRYGDKATFVLERDKSQEVSRLIIPRNLLPRESPSPRKTNQAQSSDAPRQDTASAGVLLAGVVSGGGLLVVFVRRRKVGAAAAVLIGTLALTIAMTAAMAESPRPAINQKEGEAKIVVEVTGSGDTIKLILGKDAPAIGN
jgi:hypothetical protein